MRDEQRNVGLDVGGLGLNLKQAGVLLGLVFAIVLAVVVGKQMSTEAMAVVVGIVCGVAAGIPTSILMLVLMTRRERQREDERLQQGRQGNYPPVVVIQGGTQPGLSPGAHGGYWPTPMTGPQVQRQFNVVGGDDLVLSDRDY